MEEVAFAKIYRVSVVKKRKNQKLSVGHFSQHLIDKFKVEHKTNTSSAQQRGYANVVEMQLLVMLPIRAIVMW